MPEDTLSGLPLLVAVAFHNLYRNVLGDLSFNCSDKHEICERAGYGIYILKNIFEHYK